ncbi:hypothetical protein [Conchiformibius steedae]|uniref:hypothetical protein n=1 Tax=Conchiformibius steedae TaxID=153493 RepID=UPI0026EB0B69|nr:hypothetical protein [Conchiformibius steedae]
MTHALKLKLSADSLLSFDPAAADTRRRFSGIAHSGKPFVRGNTQYVVDLSDIQTKPKTAVLIEHDPHRAAGVAVLSVSAAGLVAEGHLLDNEHGRTIADAADAEFPWEMSAYIDAKRYEEVLAGSAVTVNGTVINGPALVLRGCAVREVSFTPVGVDANTSAVVLSDGSPFDYQPTETTMSMTPEEKQQFEAMQAKLSQLEAEKAALQAEKHAAEIHAKLSAAGFKSDGNGGYEGVSAASLQVLLSADTAAAEALIGDLSVKLSASATGAAENKAPVPPALLSANLQGGEAEQAQGDGVKLSAAEATNAQGQKYV